MSKQLIFRYVFSILLSFEMLGVASLAVARPNSGYWPTGIQLGMEIANPLYYKYYQKQVDQQYEFNGAIDFASLLLEGDYGWGSNQTSDGQYTWVGLHYNLVPDTPDRNTAFLGTRYAHSFLQAFNNEMTASWYEVVAGVRIKVWKIFYVGSTIQYKFGLSLDRDWQLPHLWGWGTYSQGNNEMLGVNYYISLRIPLEHYVASQDDSPNT